jgi:RimJ/RimL family protein N-acetyltransferase
MSSTGTIAVELRSWSGPIDTAAIARLGILVPDDELRDKRMRNLAAASQVIAAVDDASAPVGLVYVRSIAGIPNVTWLVAERARRQGLAVRMLARLQQDWRLLTAVCRNEASVAVARRAGFMIAGPCAVWFRR